MGPPSERESGRIHQRVAPLRTLEGDGGDISTRCAAGRGGQADKAGLLSPRALSSGPLCSSELLPLCQGWFPGIRSLQAVVIVAALYPLACP